jgi:preprotein translocase subunit SecB
MVKFRTILRMKCLRGGIAIIPSELAAMPATLLVNAIMLLFSYRQVFERYTQNGASPRVILTPTVVALNCI